MLELQLLAMLEVVRQRYLSVPESMGELEMISREIDASCEKMYFSSITSVCQTCSNPHPIMNTQIERICTRCQSIGCDLSCGRCQVCGVETCNMCGETCYNDSHDDHIPENMVWCQKHVPRCSNCHNINHCQECVLMGFDVCRDCRTF
jgi:hypothetical protein